MIKVFNQSALILYYISEEGGEEYELFLDSQFMYP